MSTHEFEIEFDIKPNEFEIEMKHIQELYPELENLEVKPSGQEQVFEHPNSYGYDIVTVSAVASDTLNVIPKTEKQVFEGLFGIVNVEAMKIPNEQWYEKECEKWI